MPTEQRKPKGSRRTHEWGIVVRLADGSRLYLGHHKLSRNGKGDPLEFWSPSESQAVRFSSGDEVRGLAQHMQTNSQAKEYEVVQLRAR